MENYLPAVLSTPLFEEFFQKNDFYNSRELSVTQKQDDYNHQDMQAYFYRFTENDHNSLNIYIDAHAKELSGFSYVMDNKQLSIQLVPNQHEIFIGMDKISAILEIKNDWAIPLDIKGKITIYKGIKEFEQLKLIRKSDTTYHVAQAEGCSPIVSAWKAKSDIIKQHGLEIIFESLYLEWLYGMVCLLVMKKLSFNPTILISANDTISARRNGCISTKDNTI